MIKHRRHLHQHPELSFQEEQTAQYIKDFYKGKDVTVTQPVTESHAVIVEIKGVNLEKRLVYVLTLMHYQSKKKQKLNLSH